MSEVDGQTMPTDLTEVETNTPSTDSPGTPPRSVDWENPRVKSILEAAAVCFARKGFSATTLAEIGKELGLRKSIIHYYFASKAALIHEVQSFTYHQFLDRTRARLRAEPDQDTGTTERAMGALRQNWTALKENKTTVWLNIEVWAAARRDDELKRRAATLHEDSRALVSEVIKEVLDGQSLDGQMDSVSSLIIAVLNGLTVGEYLEGDRAKADEAYEMFLFLLRLGLRELDTNRAATGA